MTTSCHHHLKRCRSTNNQIITQYAEKKEQRRQMQCGERPEGCNYCWKIEDMGPEHLSDRVYKSGYIQMRTNRCIHKNHTEDFDLES